MTNYKNENTKFSLIIATLDRHEMLLKCLNQLRSQTYRNFEVIVVDQTDTQFDFCCYEFSFEFIYIHIEVKGLSFARNVGIDNASGDYICLVDDDSLYDPKVLEVANRVISQTHPTILGGQMIDPVSGKRKCYSKDAILRWWSSFRCIASPTMIIDRDFLRIHPFDERFGVGATYGSGEETDIILAALKQKRLVLYSSEYKVYHHVESPYATDKERISLYAYGRGALLKKTVTEYSFFWGSFLFLKTFLYNRLVSVLGIMPTEQRKMKATKARALLKGFNEYSPK